MTLQTYEEQEILRRVRDVERKLDRLFILCELILKDVEPPKYRPTARIAVTPVHHHGHHHPHW